MFLLFFFAHNGLAFGKFELGMSLAMKLQVMTYSVRVSRW